jgi:hypothetical protein
MGSPSPTTTASKDRRASSGTAVAWIPPMTVFAPRERNRSESAYASGACAVNVAIAAQVALRDVAERADVLDLVIGDLVTVRRQRGERQEREAR